MHGLNDKAATVAIHSKSKTKKKGRKGAQAQQHRINEDSLIINGIGDVMSSSSADSNPDPDLHPEPQSSSRCSDVIPLHI